MMNELSIFAPLVNPNYCLLFYYLSVIGVILTTLTVIIFIMTMMKNFKMSNASSIFIPLSVSILAGFIFYFQNRILYSMCKNTMKNK